MLKILSKLIYYPFNFLSESVLFASFFDAYRFRKYSQISKNIHKLPLRAAQSDLLRRMHSLEKGMALPNPLPNFGVQKCTELMHQARIYRRHFGEDWYFQTCIGVLEEYKKFQQAYGIKTDVLEEFLREYPNKAPGGTICLNKELILKHTVLNFREFVASRHSVRNFTTEPVDEVLVMEAIDIARKSPSVCNRSTGRVYVSMDSSVISHALSIQGGSRGFAQTVQCLLVIASDLESFYKTGERYQPWVDGGLFAMTLLYALHSLGLGTCMLNWSKTPLQDRKLRKSFDINDHHNVVAMIAVGHIPTTLDVAMSPRPDIGSFVQKLELRGRR